MDRGRVGEDRGSKEMDGCPLTTTRKTAAVTTRKTVAETARKTAAEPTRKMAAETAEETAVGNITEEIETETANITEEMETEKQNKTEESKNVANLYHNRRNTCQTDGETILYIL
jgi:hypothetical protein